MRSDSLAASMSNYLIQRLDADPRITLHYQCQITALHGEEKLEAVTVKNGVDGTDNKGATSAVFLMIGAAPFTEWLDDQIELDGSGFILTGQSGASQPSSPGQSSADQVEATGSKFQTSMPGVYAVGDVRAESVKRVASAVGEGSVVISDVHRYLSAQAE